MLLDLYLPHYLHNVTALLSQGARLRFIFHRYASASDPLYMHTYIHTYIHTHIYIYIYSHFDSFADLLSEPLTDGSVAGRLDAVDAASRDHSHATDTFCALPLTG